MKPTWILTVLFVLMSPAIKAQLKLAGIFADNMVLQQKAAVPVWGEAAPGKKISVRFAGQVKETVSDPRGNWRVLLEPLNASAKGATLTVSDGTSSVKATDVLVGEVWLCSGQSNMGVSLAGSDNADKVIAAASHPTIRQFKVPQTPALAPRTDVHSRWVPCTPATARPFSAIGYFFAQKLQQQLNVPVGIIVSAWGGSSVVAWMSEEMLSDPYLKKHVPYELYGYFENHRPRLLYNGMLHPLIPFAVKGVLWYQGETDAMDDRFNPFLYRSTFKQMITGWRRAWGRPKMPFYFVQLPNLYGGRVWPVLRESQDIVHRALPHTGMITTIDIGQSRKLHPANKSDFAYRLANLVLAREYGSGNAVAYPAFSSMKAERNAIHITLTHAAGLKTKDGHPPAAFEIAGKDKQFKPAIARIECNKIIVSHKEIAGPVAVRYAFVPDPKVNVVNGNGLPLRPFRTDNWPVYGQARTEQPLVVKLKLGVNTSAPEIADGKHAGWKWMSQAAVKELSDAKMITKTGNNRVRIQVINRRNGKANEKDAPVIAWKKELSASTTGLTFELEAQMMRATNPFLGFFMEAGLVMEGKMHRYRIGFAPMTVTAFREEFIYVLGHDLNNTGFHKYRLAVRKDGICQVYFDNRLIGIVPPEVVEAKEEGSGKPFITYGKIKKEGDISVNVSNVAYDVTGAYAPAEKSAL